MSSRARPCGHKRQRSSNDIDRISDLPKSVLCHILSFFPTEDAVATSFLSTRWKFLWTNIHNLSFIESICSRFFWRNIKDRKIKFAHFINKVLLFLNGQSIDKFCLEIEEYCELYDATTWIATAVARKLKVLEFCLSVSDPSDPHIQFPCSLFTCKMLEVLVLRCDVSLNVPSLVCLPNLKTLHLEGVSYQCDESVRKLISGLSSLETLYIERDVYDNVVTFTISSPTLRNLTFTFDEPTSHFPEDIDYKLEINAPALRYLDLSDRMSRDFSVANLCSLHEANVRTNVIKDEANVPLIDYDHYSRAVVKLLQGVYNVKHLLLGDDTLECILNPYAP